MSKIANCWTNEQPNLKINLRSETKRNENKSAWIRNWRKKSIILNSYLTSKLVAAFAHWKHSPNIINKGYQKDTHN